MKQIKTDCVGIDQGSVVLFSDYQEGGDMWTGKGAREVRKYVRFSSNYVAPPAVSVGITMWDMDQKTNQRADISADDISERGFFLVFRTWSDTRVARIRADWMSIGALRDESQWDV